MKYYIHNKSGKFEHRPFDSFKAAWDYIEFYIPKGLHMNLYVIGE